MKKRHTFSSTKALICMEMHDWEKTYQEIPRTGGGGGGSGKGNITTSGCHTVQHSMMPVKHVPYFYTVAVQGLVHETVNEAVHEQWQHIAKLD